MYVPVVFAPRWRWLLLLPALACLSCGRGGVTLNPVQGKVLYKNEPLKGATVTFHPKGATDELTALRPVGLTKEDGTFTLTTGQKEGAPAGEYTVTFICSEVVQPKKSKVISMAPPESRDRLQGAYANRERSTIHVQIKSGVNQLEPFSLK